MKHTREFEIAWQGLKPGEHTYIYDLDDQFMQERGAGEDFRNWNARITFTFDKHENFFMLHFDVDGNVTVGCDRCGSEFELRLWDEFDLVIKLMGLDGEEMPDEEDDVVFIPRSETVIDIADWLYEFTTLSVPLQHIHPDKPDGTPGCDPAALDLLGKLTENEHHTENELWKGLEALKNLQTPQEKSKRQKKQ